VAGFLEVHAKRAEEVSGKKRRETERSRERELISTVRFSMERERERSIAQCALRVSVSVIRISHIWVLGI
jgi:hypothetical protein